jgi:pimeloyl-ACP methyl ester carboxylesterase
VSQIEAIAPAGPIVLAGYSLGGNVAHLAAQRLITRGRSVALLVIFATDGRLVLPSPDPVEYLTQAPGLRRIRELAIEGRRADARNAIVRTIVGHLIHPRWAPLLWLTARVRVFGWFGDYGFSLNWLMNMALLKPRSLQISRSTVA